MTSTARPANPPPTGPVRRLIDGIHAAAAALPPAGAPADYIPELADADPDLLGLSLATARGEQHSVGDADVPFTIQSISKAIVYGLALDDHGIARVRGVVGVEPTGEAFNSIRLQPDSGHPYNPMVNAGAIATTGLVAGADAQERLARILATVGRYTGTPAEVDEAVYLSERETGHRNRAIAHLLRNFGVLDGDPEETLDVYFRQCSTLVTCRGLAMIGATLANKGVNPLTGERAIQERHVANVLSVMATCGMYDAAGRWLFEVGLPAKSGVAGGILAVLPGQVGIGAFSPPLDENGNSVRGVFMCREASKVFKLHLLDPPRPGPADVGRSWTAAEHHSARRRTRRAAAELRRRGGAIRVHQLRGDLAFSAAAASARRLLETAPADGFVILDLDHVDAVDVPAAAIVAGLGPLLAGRGTQLVVVGAEGHPEVEAALDGVEGVARWRHVDAAQEWAEDTLLERAGLDLLDDGHVPLADSDLCEGMTPAEVEVLEEAMPREEHPAGAILVRRGDSGDGLLVIESGRVELIDGDPGDDATRVAVLGAGTFLGETELIEGHPRTTTVLADTPVAVRRLRRSALDVLPDEAAMRPRSRVLMNIASGLAERLRRSARLGGA